MWFVYNIWYRMELYVYFHWFAVNLGPENILCDFSYEFIEAVLFDK